MSVNSNSSDGRIRPDVAVQHGRHAGSDVDVLPSVLDLTQAQHVRDAIKALLCGSATIVVDAADVVRMSTPCIQVLLAAGRAASSAGGSFEIRNASPAFQSAIADLGLLAAFTDWMS